MGRSPEVVRWRGGWTMVAKWRRGGTSVEVALELEEERRRAGMGATETGREAEAAGKGEVVPVNGALHCHRYHE
jgi:hypothetical protein